MTLYVQVSYNPCVGHLGKWKKEKEKEKEQYVAKW
jgi:hypothetical protein